MASTTCKALTKKGKPCQAPLMPGSEYCPFHDPARAVQRAKQRSKGGKARHGRVIGSVNTPLPPVTIATIDDVLAVVTQAINDQRRLENSSMRNRTLGSLASVAMECLKVGELEQRIAALEAMINSDPRTPLQRAAADELARRQALKLAS